MKTRSKRSDAKNCLSSINDSVESIVQGIKILYKATGGSKVNSYSFGS